LAVPPAWTSYTPVIKQSTTVVTQSATNAKYIKYGSVAHVWAVCTLSSNGSSGGIVEISLPSAVNSPVNGEIVGTFGYLKATVAYYVGFAFATGGVVYGMAHLEGNYIGADPSFTAGANDKVFINLTYEVTP
jgi:hypothetical protein